MVIDRFNSLRRTDALYDFETVYEFTYQGSTNSRNGICESDVRQRIRMAKSVMDRFSKIWKYSSISNTVKISACPPNDNTVIVSIFLYVGVETWTLRCADRRRIDAF